LRKSHCVLYHAISGSHEFIPLALAFAYQVVESLAD
jgi:hypothetical protein